MVFISIKSYPARDRNQIRLIFKELFDSSYELLFIFHLLLPK